MSPIVGRVSDRRGRRFPSLLGLSVAAVLMLLFPWPQQPWQLIALVLLASPALGMLWAPSMALLSDGAEAVGIAQGFAFALSNVGWSIGQTTGSAGSARLADAAGDAAPYLVLAVVTAGSALALARAGVGRAVAAGAVGEHALRRAPARARRELLAVVRQHERGEALGGVRREAGEAVAEPLRSDLHERRAGLDGAVRDGDREPAAPRRLRDVRPLDADAGGADVERRRGPGVALGRIGEPDGEGERRARVAALLPEPEVVRERDGEEAPGAHAGGRPAQRPHLAARLEEDHARPAHGELAPRAGLRRPGGQQRELVAREAHDATRHERRVVARVERDASALVEDRACRRGCHQSGDRQPARNVQSTRRTYPGGAGLRLALVCTQHSSAIHRNRRPVAQSLGSLGAACARGKRERVPPVPVRPFGSDPTAGGAMRAHGAAEGITRRRSGAVAGTSGRPARRAGGIGAVRGRTRLAGIAVAASASAALVWSATGNAAVNAPHFINVFPSRDFVHIEGYTPGAQVKVTVHHDPALITSQSNAGQDASATGTVGADGIFEVNHPGGACWTGFTPDIRPGDTVSVSDPAAAPNTPPLDSMVVQNVAGGRPIQTAPDTIVVHGAAANADGSRPNVALLGSRLINPIRFFANGGKRNLDAPSRDL